MKLAEMLASKKTAKTVATDAKSLNKLFTTKAARRFAKKMVAAGS